MTTSVLYPWFITSTLIAIVLAFFFSNIEVGKKFGSTYQKVIISAWIKLLGSLMPVIIYAVISMARGGWEKIFRSPELSAAAFTILFMSCYQLSLGLTVTHSLNLKPNRVGVVGGWALCWLIAAVISVVLIYQAEVVSGAVIFWQIILLIVAVLTYFGTAVVTELLRAGYVPKICTSIKDESPSQQSNPAGLS